MARAVALAVASLLCLSAVVDEPRDVDLVGRAGDVPRGWFVPTPGYTAEMVDDGGVDGGAHAVLSSTGEGDSAGFGNLMTTVDARPFRGRLLRLRATLVLGEDTPPHVARMWVRVDREDGARGFFDNMATRPVTSTDWTPCETVGEVADDAVSIAFGVMLQTAGEVAVDDVSLEALDSVPGFEVEPPRALSRRGLDNLVATTELLALVRHFHPSDEAAGADWNAVALAAVRACEDAGSARELAEALSATVAPLAPTVVVVPASEVRRDELPAHDASLDVVAWRHRGFGHGQGDEGGIYSRERVRGGADAGFVDRLLGATPASALPSPSEPLRVDLAGRVTAFVPLAVHVDETGASVPRATAPLPASPPRTTGDDRATRLAAVALAWGVFEHFYPYFDVVDVDRDAQLRASLARAAEDDGEEAFLWTLRELVAALQDGHGGVYHSSDPRTARLPALFAWVGDEVVVSAVHESVDDVEVGDVVVAVDGTPVDAWVDEMSDYVSAATPQYRRFRLAEELRRGAPGTASRLTLRGADGRTRRVTLPHRTDVADLVEPRPAPIADLAPGVVYVDVERVDDDAYTAALPRLADAERIVFDVRGYPGRLSAHVFLGPLVDAPVRSAQWHVPDVTRPDEPMDFTLGGWPVMPTEPHLDGERVFVTDGRAISYAETCLGIVEHFGLGAIVGEATAGTNGNINPFTLPGGYRVVWTGMKVLKHDGSQHHGIGIVPTHPVERTVEGIREGRDELLEAALTIDVAR